MKLELTLAAPEPYNLINFIPVRGREREGKAIYPIPLNKLINTASSRALGKPGALEPVPLFPYDPVCFPFTEGSFPAAARSCHAHGPLPL